MKWFSIFVVGVAVTGAVFWTVRSQGRIPAMPRVAISEAEQRQTMSALFQRESEFKWREEDQKMRDELRALHELETADSGSPAQRAALGEQLEEMRESLKSAAAEDEERFLLLGDVLAVEFHRSVFALLDEMKKKGGKTLLNKENSQLKAVRQSGGSFFKHALEKGLVGEDGQLNAPLITPQVLFRYRWRRLAGLAWGKGFLPIEKKSYLEFIVRFSTKSLTVERLNAVEALHALDGAYDKALPRALIFYEGKRIDEARFELEKAIADNRMVDEARAFLRSLEK